MISINGLDLPAELEADLLAGENTLSAREVAHLSKLLKHIRRPEPRLFDAAGVERENKLWINKEAVRGYLGTSSLFHRPGNIDPRKTVNIGVAGDDAPISLDYRVNPPRVIYLSEIGPMGHWLILAPTYNALRSKIA